MKKANVTSGINIIYTGKNPKEEEEIKKVEKPKAFLIKKIIIGKAVKQTSSFSA
jgi:hypothetical protein